MYCPLDTTTTASLPPRTPIIELALVFRHILALEHSVYRVFPAPESSRGSRRRTATLGSDAGDRFPLLLVLSTWINQKIA